MGIVRVLAVDNHPMLRRVVAFNLEDALGIEIVGEAGSGPEALQKAAELSPDVVLLDLGLPGLGGVEVIRRLKEEGCEARIVVLTAHDEPEPLFDCMRLGISAFLDKGVAPEQVRAAIEAAGRGESAITPEQNRAFMGQLERFLIRTRDAEGLLSDRERDVLSLLARGETNRRIGRTLHLSDKTVESHVSRIYRKFGVTRRVDAVRRARELHLI